MATPQLALRFRDTTPGIDSIDAHRDVLRREKAVWWGWWKKEFEDDHGARLTSEATSSVLLIDRSTRRCFVAGVVRVDLGSDIDEVRVPSYYWQRRDQVAAWFLLTTIQDQPYPEELADSLGQSTILFLQDEVSPAESTSIELSVPERSILHISDLHFGSDYNFLPPGSVEPFRGVKTLTECLRADLERVGASRDVGAIIASGDFTTGGDWSDKTRQQILAELASLRGALSVPESHLLSLPGNHDVVRYGSEETVDVAVLAVEKQTSYKHEREYRTFSEELTGRGWREPLNYNAVLELPECDVEICSLNSCTIVSTQWTEYGYVGTAGLDLLSELGRRVPRRPTYRVMCLHHHLVPVTAVEAPNGNGVSLTLDAVEVLSAAQNAGIQVVLHGHQHQASIATYGQIPFHNGRTPDPMLIVSGGSAGVKEARRPGAERNTYALLRFGPSGVDLTLRELRSDGKQGGELYQGPLPIQPLLPP